MALSYSSRWEIVNAVKQIVNDVKEGKLTASDITQEVLHQYLTTKAFPDPELMIRTSGEYRISNFYYTSLLMQSFILPVRFGPISGRKEPVYGNPGLSKQGTSFWKNRRANQK